VERRRQVVEGDRLAIIPELPVAKIAAPFHIEPVGSLKRDVLAGRELKLLAGGQHMIEGDFGVERKLLRRSDIGACLLKDLVRLRGNRRCWVGSSRGLRFARWGCVLGPCPWQKARGD